MESIEIIAAPPSTKSPPFPMYGSHQQSPFAWAANTYAAAPITCVLCDPVHELVWSAAADGMTSASILESGEYEAAQLRPYRSAASGEVVVGVGRVLAHPGRVVSAVGRGRYVHIRALDHPIRH